MKPVLLLNISIVLITVMGSNIMAAGQPVSTSLIGNVAINGYDPVAYFKAGKAMKGIESISFKWRDANWHFTSKENRDLFATAPEKYAPQYGGYCAWAMTEARKAVTDPEVWKIADGKLYLNCSSSAMEKWERDIPGHIKKADANWLKLIGSD
jgi:hypothetical protein